MVEDIIITTEAPAPLNDVSQGARFIFGGSMELKKPTSFDEQIECFREKNIIIDNSEECKNFLRKVNYYRLSAYYLPFKGEDGKCKFQVSFERIQKIYEFDQNLRSLILGTIEDIEIQLRTQIAYHSAHKYGPDGYMLSSTYNAKHDHASFISHITNCINENAKTLVVQHHMKKYDGKFPIWVIIEFFSIGMLSHFYRGMQTTDKKAIAKALYGTSHFVLESWTRCITDLRNKCAHYSRLYYTKFPAIPKMPNNENYIPTRRLFAQIIMLKYMYPDKEKWDSCFVAPLCDLINEYSSYIDLAHLDFPVEWKEILLNK